MQQVHAYTSLMCLEHKLFPFFLEKPARLESLQAAFGKSAQIIWHADVEPASLHALTAAHAPGYVKRVHDLSHMQPLHALFSQLGDKRLQWYTRVSPGSYDAARYAAGAVLEALEDVAAGAVTRAFCALRPPGHHAGPERGEGFCLFNNVAIGALAAREQGLRVAIVDFDRHHGNGTEAIIARRNDPGLLFISSYQEGCKYAQGALQASSVNVPIPQHGGYAAVDMLYDRAVVPALQAFKPDLLMISAGFDMHESDPLSNIKLKAADYEHLTHKLLNATNASTKGRVISVMEGGYDRPALVQCVGHHLAALRAG